jgi:hypothetical protein
MKSGLIAVLTTVAVFTSCGKVKSKSDDASGGTGSQISSCDFTKEKNPSQTLSTCQEAKDADLDSFKSACDGAKTSSGEKLNADFSVSACNVPAGTIGCTTINKHGVEITIWYRTTSEDLKGILKNSCEADKGKIATK